MWGGLSEANNLSNKEYTLSQSKLSAKELIKNKKRLNRKDFVAGTALFLSYNAKHKEFTYDKTPLVLVLRTSAKYTLGLNFHWLPFMMRQALAFKIVQMNKSNIDNDRPLVFTYRDLKPFLKQFGYAPVIRLYINSRFSKQGVVIPASKLPQLAKMRGETFMQGKHTSGSIFARVNKAAKKAKAASAKTRNAKIVKARIAAKATKKPRKVYKRRVK